ncbi:FecR domain-containing protein, partial [Planctomycetota bacterium]
VVLRWAVAAAAVVLVVGGVLVHRAGRYQRIGEMAEVVGQPQVRQRGAARASAAREREAVCNGAELVTAPAEKLAVRFADGSRLVLSEGTKATLSGEGYFGDCGHYLPHVCLHHGEVLCELKSLRHFRGVGTPLGTAIVEGTVFRMKYVRGDHVLLEVLEGAVQFSCPEGEVRAEAGTTWVVDAGKQKPRRVSGPPE